MISLHRTLCVSGFTRASSKTCASGDGMRMQGFVCLSACAEAGQGGAVTYGQGDGGETQGVPQSLQ